MIDLCAISFRACILGKSFLGSPYHCNYEEDTLQNYCSFVSELPTQ